MLTGLTVAEWTGLIAAIATGIGGVVAGVFTGLKWLKVEDNKVLLKIETVKAATAKLEALSRAKNQEGIIREKDAVIELRSKEVHDLRGEFQTTANRLAIAETKMTMMSQQMEYREKEYSAERAEILLRLQQCEEDRREMWEVLNRHGITKIIPPNEEG